LILLLVTSILTNQEAVLRRFVATIYEYFMQQEGIFTNGRHKTHGKPGGQEVVSGDIILILTSCRFRVCNKLFIGRRSAGPLHKRR
jgi:hypothetical protein